MIEQTYLNELTNYTNTKIAKVVLNGTIVITSFLIKTVTVNTIAIEYMVAKGSPTITKIELKSAADAVVSSRIVNVPIVEDTIMRHVISVEEVI
ncbi:ketopantoate hydroxymethyltransferase [Cohnella sp. GCM10020058]|uniref:ketopantoate hydroxymethyltransferase n=1 Tax=Cohnella sp. GCM10020058 TaxID=3317330 RepID=UPI003641E76B